MLTCAEREARSPHQHGLLRSSDPAVRMDRFMPHIIARTRLTCRARTAGLSMSTIDGANFASYGLRMNIFLWILQILLAALFLMAGATKLTQPKEKLEPRMSWVGNVTSANVKLLAAAEVLGALGLILPWALGIAKVLTPLAAVGLAVVMVGAVAVHVRRKEPWYMQAVLFVLAVVVAVLRFKNL